MDWILIGDMIAPVELLCLSKMQCGLLILIANVGEDDVRLLVT